MPLICWWYGGDTYGEKENENDIQWYPLSLYENLSFVITLYFHIMGNVEKHNCYNVSVIICMLLNKTITTRNIEFEKHGVFSWIDEIDRTVYIFLYLKSINVK